VVNAKEAIDVAIKYLGDLPETEKPRKKLVPIAKSIKVRLAEF